VNSHDGDRFNQWAESYDRHWMQRFIFEPVQRTVLELASQEIPLPRNILDIGCGTGRLLRSAEAAFPGATLLGVDAAIEMVKQAQASVPAKSAIHFQNATAEALPFADARFDLIFSTLTFHHWHEQDRGIAEVARVLIPGGRWVLADFMPAGLLRYVRRVVPMKQFPVRQELDGRLAAFGLVIKARRSAPGLGGQVAVLAIGATGVGSRP
jgi:ubiquinone/menaquinone biosynthesis C-methylase UbiE